MSAQKTRVLIVGAGAAGSAAAWSLSRFPEKFDVTVIDPAPRAGGVATSIPIRDASGSDAKLYINDGVQGGAYSYRNVLQLHKMMGFDVSPVDMKISFGNGDAAWTNYLDSKLTQRLQPEIKRFGSVLKWINRLEALFIVIPIRAVLKLFRFSDDFCNGMVYPLVALFFGTGNQTPFVSAAVIARVFLDSQLRIFEYDEKRLLSQTPRMFAFPKLHDVYAALTRNTSATFLFNRTVTRVQRGVQTSEGQTVVRVTDSEGDTRDFDRVVFCCNAESVLAALGGEATWLEKRVLGNVKYYNDITISHEDADYMKRHYEYNPGRGDQYFVRTDPSDPSKIEMSFDLSCYQPQLRALGDERAPVFQSIFLDDRDKASWTIDAIRPERIVARKWWRQFSHTWRHFAFTVPFVRCLQGKDGLYFAGAYTLFNTHELATISGLAVADRLGAPYPFADDQLAADQFDTFMWLAHGKRRSNAHTAGQKAKPRSCKDRAVDALMLLAGWVLLLLAYVVHFFRFV